MILTAATQSGIWGYTNSQYNSMLLPDPAGLVPTQGNMGVWSAPTLAPNGLMYCLPMCYSLDNGVTKFNFIAVGKTSSNQEKTKWFFISADGTATRPSIPDNGNAQATTQRYGERGILAPNGLIYFLPRVNGPSSILIMNPGSGLTTASGIASILGTTLTITTVSTGVFGIGQTISFINPIGGATIERTITKFNTGTGGVGTYTLNSAAPNGAVGVNISGSEFPNCTWELVTYASINTATGTSVFSNTAFRSALLGKDGYIYLLPSGSALARIAPRNTAVNGTSADIYQVHSYYNGSSVARSFYNNTVTSAAIYMTPKDNTGAALSKTAPYPTANIQTGTYVGAIQCGVQHPNGKIYMAGQTRWIFVLDPSKWNDNDPTIVYSKNTLALRTDLCLTTIRVKDLALEKPKSNYIALVKSTPSYAGGSSITINVTDTTYIYVGMTLTVYSGTGEFGIGTIQVQSVNPLNSSFTAINLSGSDVITTNFEKGDQIEATPTQQMLESVNIFWIPDTALGTNQPVDNLRNIYRIDPQTETISAIGQGMSTAVPGSGEAFNSILALLANGTIYKPATTTQNSTTYIRTGSDISTTLPFTVKQYNRDTPGPNTILPGIGTSVIKPISPFSGAMGSYTKSGGTITLTGNSLGKVVFPSGSAGSVVGEIISVKGYSPFTRYFNYAPSDKNVFEIPANLANLTSSLYNLYFNKTC